MFKAPKLLYKAKLPLNRHLKNIFLFRAFASYKGVDYTPIIMPKLSPTAEESRVAEWLVKEGESIEAGDSYCNIETDKATLSHDSLEDGYIAKIFQSDEKIKINSIIGVHVENEGDIKVFENFTVADFSEDSSGAKEEKGGNEKEAVPAEKEVAEEKNGKTEKPSQKEEDQKQRIFITPAARKEAEKQGVDYTKITKEGANAIDRVVTLSDIKGKPKTVPIAAKKAKAPLKSLASAEAYVDTPLTAMRETIAKRLLESKQTIPHFNVTMDCQMDKILAFRAELNKEENVKISVNDLIVKATALALKKVPEVNSSWHKTFIRSHQVADVCVAVSTPTGLFTPIVKNADLLGLNDISKSVKDLATRAREGTLRPEEFIGGTFTISNLGMMGVTEFSAIINPPQAAILAVGTTQDQFYLNDKKEPASKKVMKVTLACDHRVVDGAKAAEWLVAFKRFLENPITMAL